MLEHCAARPNTSARGTEYAIALIQEKAPAIPGLPALARDNIET